MKIKKIALFVIAISIIVGCNLNRNNGKFTIAIVQLLEHQEVENVTAGIKDELKYLDSNKYEIIVRNAQGQTNMLPQIYTELKGKDIKILVPIFTPTTQSAKNEFRDIPIIFSAVTDPVGAGVVNSLEKPGNNITGVSDLFPVDLQLRLIKEIIPATKRLGVLYNPGEQNSASTYKLIVVEGQKQGFDIIPSGVTNSNEILQACSALKDKADVFYTCNDITVASGIDGVVKYCQDNKIPFFAGDPAAVNKGAIATYSQSYYQIGRMTGEIVRKVIDGANPGNIPVVVSKSAELIINSESALKMGVVIPESVLNKVKNK